MNRKPRLLAPAVPLALAMVLGLAASTASAEYKITQWTIAGGGVIEATNGDWQLSGTIGQWDATEARALTGGSWRLTGGFWGLSLDELADLIFSDRFAQAPSLTTPTEGASEDRTDS